MLTRMTRMARMLTHMLTRMTRWLAGSHIIHTRPCERGVCIICEPASHASQHSNLENSKSTNKNPYTGVI